MDPRAKTALLALSVLGAVVSVDLLRERVTERLHKVHEQNDVYALPPPGYVKVLSLGYREAVASLLWASTLYQYGDAVGHNQRFHYATQYLETIVELDPDLRPAYRFASTLTTMQAVAPQRFELDRVRALLERGTRELPYDPDVWGAYATFMMFEGAQYLDPKEKNEWRLLGARAASRAVELGYVMDTLSITGAVFLAQAGERDLAIAQLERAYSVAPNDETRDRIAARLRRLQASQALERVERMARFFVNSWRDQAPWVSESLFAVVGPSRDVARCAGLAGADPRCAPGWASASAR